MKVYELIEKLEEMPQNLQVLISQDSAGNGFSADIEVENDSNQYAVLWPGYFDEIDEVIENYEFIDEE